MADAVRRSASLAFAVNVTDVPLKAVSPPVMVMTSQISPAAVSAESIPWAWACRGFVDTPDGSA